MPTAKRIRTSILGRRTTDPLQIFWCGNLSGPRGTGWSFPPQLEKFLREKFKRKSVLHLFGGQAKFGTRMDIDASTRPDVIGDAWVPPFARDSFDVVIIDPPYPPYMPMNPHLAIPLLQNAAWLARETVVWFHPLWISGYSFLKLRRSWLVRVGDYAEIRCLQFLGPIEPKFTPTKHFRRGPAIKYNRWLSDNLSLPLVHQTERENHVD